MTSNIKSNNISKLQIEKYFTGELGSDQQELIKTHLQDCSRCRNYLTALEENHKEFHQVHSFNALIEPLKITPQNGLNKYLKMLQQPIFRPVFITLLVLCISLPLFRTLVHDPSKFRYKGGEQISFIYQRNDMIFPGSITDTFQRNDEIQIIYNSSKYQYLALFSIDSKGTVSFYQPLDNNKQTEWVSVEINKGSKVHFPSSIILDESPGYELIIASFTNKPLREKQIRHWLGQYQSTEALLLPDLEKKLSGTSVTPKGKTVTLLLKKR